jgi:hypothetical protein
MRSSLIILSFLLLSITAKSQKWQPGYFYDIRGTKNAGFIRVNPSGKGPIKDEGFIEFKEDDKASPIKLSTSDLRSFVAGRDSFIVAAAPRGGWSKYEVDFVRVAVDGPIRLFEAKGSGGGGGSGFGIQPGISMGASTGGYGSGFGGGISIPIGGGGGRGSSKTVYFFGENTAVMQPLTNENFIDIMSEIMGDEPDVVEKIQTKKFGLNNMDKLLAYFKQEQGARK